MRRVEKEVATPQNTHQSMWSTLSLSGLGHTTCSMIGKTDHMTGMLLSHDSHMMWKGTNLTSNVG